MERLDHWGLELTPRAPKVIAVAVSGCDRRRYRLLSLFPTVVVTAFECLPWLERQKWELQRHAEIHLADGLEPVLR